MTFQQPSALTVTPRTLIGSHESAATWNVWVTVSSFAGPEGVSRRETVSAIFTLPGCVNVRVIWFSPAQHVASPPTFQPLTFISWTFVVLVTHCPGGPPSYGGGRHCTSLVPTVGAVEALRNAAGLPTAGVPSASIAVM